PLPKARSIWPRAASKAFCLSMVSLSNRRNAVCDIPLPSLFHGGPTVAIPATDRDKKVNVPSLFFSASSIFVPIMYLTKERQMGQKTKRCERRRLLHPSSRQIAAHVRSALVAASNCAAPQRLSRSIKPSQSLAKSSI